MPKWRGSEYDKIEERIERVNRAALALISLNRESDRNSDCTMGIAGIQGVGKTTFVNALLGYPLFPTCQTTGTAIPVRIEYGKIPEIVVGNMPLLQNGLTNNVFVQLIQYACDCLNYNIISFNNLEYFSNKRLMVDNVTQMDFMMSFGNKQHEAVLLLILLTAYVGQEGEIKQKNIEKIISMRKSILALLQIPNVSDLGMIKVYWNAEILVDGLKLLDLPGIGSNVSYLDKSGGISLDEITKQYIQSCDLMLCMTTGECVCGMIKEVVALFLNSEKLKEVLQKETRVIAVINQADCMIDYKTSAHIYQSIFEDIDMVPIYPISAIGGEYLFVKKGFPVKRTILWKNQLSKQFQEFQKDLKLDNHDIDYLAEDLLQKKYRMEYEYMDFKGNQKMLSLKQFMEQILPSYYYFIIAQRERERIKETRQTYAIFEKDIVLCKEYLKRRMELYLLAKKAITEGFISFLADIHIDIIDIQKIMNIEKIWAKLSCYKERNAVREQCEQIFYKLNHAVKSDLVKMLTLMNGDKSYIITSIPTTKILLMPFFLNYQRVKSMIDRWIGYDYEKCFEQWHIEHTKILRNIEKNCKEYCQKLEYGFAMITAHIYKKAEHFSEQISTLFFSSKSFTSQGEMWIGKEEKINFQNIFQSVQLTLIKNIENLLEVYAIDTKEYFNSFYQPQNILAEKTRSMILKELYQLFQETHISGTVPDILNNKMPENGAFSLDAKKFQNRIASFDLQDSFFQIDFQRRLDDKHVLKKQKILCKKKNRQVREALNLILKGLTNNKWKEEYDKELEKMYKRDEQILNTIQKAEHIAKRSKKK